MMYISKGIASRQPNESDVSVSHCGTMYKLTDQHAALWLNGRWRPGFTRTADQEFSLKRFVELGIAEATESYGAAAIFQLLINCVICPRIPAPILPLMNQAERRIWRWITKAGLRLTIAELVYLSEKGISPTAELLGAGNRQALTEAIYSSETIFEGILESVMEHSPARDMAVETVLGLLAKQKLFLI